MQQFQPPPGQWVWQSAPQPQPVPVPNPIRLIQHWYEWLILAGDLLALVLITASLVAQSVQQTGGWVW